MQPLTSEQTALIYSDDDSKIDTINKEFKEDISIRENSGSDLENKAEKIENISSESKLDSSEENTLDQETELNAADSSVIEEDKPVILDATETILSDSEKNAINQPEEDINPQETLNAPAMADLLPVEIVASEVVILESGNVVETQEVTKEAVSLDQQEMVNSFNEVDFLQETESINKEKAEGSVDEVEKSEVNFETTEGSFSRAGIPAPSLVLAPLLVSPGNFLVPAVVDQSQSQAFAALQALKVYLKLKATCICW